MTVKRSELKYRGLSGSGDGEPALGGELSSGAVGTAACGSAGACPCAWRCSSRIAALARRPSGRFADFSEIGVHTCLCLKLVGRRGGRFGLTMDDAWEQARPKATGLECTDLSFIGLPFPILYPLVIMQSRTAASSSWARCPCDGVWKAEMDELLCLHAESPLRRTNS